MVWLLLIPGFAAYFFIGYAICYLFHKAQWITYDDRHTKDSNQESKEVTFLLFGFFWPFAICPLYPLMGMCLLFQKVFNGLMEKDDEKKGLRDFVKKCQTDKSEKHRNL